MSTPTTPRDERAVQPTPDDQPAPLSPYLRAGIARMDATAERIFARNPELRVVLEERLRARSERADAERP